MISILIGGDFVFPSDAVLAELYPVSSKLAGGYFTKESAVTATKNIRVGASAAASVEGSPTFQPHSALMGEGLGDINTGIAPPLGFTFVVVAKPAPTTLIGNYKESSGNRTGIIISGSTMFVSAGTSGGNRFVTIDLVGSNFQFLAGGMSATAGSVPKVWVGQEGALRSSPGGTSGTRIAESEPVRIGGPYIAPDFPGTNDIALALIYNDLLTDAEVAEVYQWARDYAAGEGLVGL